jgi:hypothetical protein
MDSARGRAGSAVNRNHAPGDAFDELRGVIGKRDEGVDGFGHGKVS